MRARIMFNNTLGSISLSPKKEVAPLRAMEQHSVLIKR